MTMVICNKCKRQKKHAAHGLCYSCDSVTRQKAKRAMFSAYVDKYKTDKGCIDCGYNKHPKALDFDHVRGDKKANISRLVRVRSGKGKEKVSFTMDFLIAEISKCEVRCSNCHRITTYERLENNKNI